MDKNTFREYTEELEQHGYYKVPSGARNSMPVGHAEAEFPKPIKRFRKIDEIRDRVHSGAPWKYDHVDADDDDVHPGDTEQESE